MELQILTEYPDIHLETRNNLTLLCINDQSSFLERYELLALSYGALMLANMIKQFLFDKDFEL